MKNKKLYRRLYCAIVCMMLFIANCAAMTVKKHWWGAEYYMGSDEISAFRLKAQDLFTTIEVAHQGAAVAASVVAGAPGAVAGETVAAVQHIAIQRLLTELERWESKGKAIVLSLPKVIQGWHIEA